jgi:hypothetical protein
MRWLGWHSLLMNSFPCSNADVRRIELGTLLGQVLASLFPALSGLRERSVRRDLPAGQHGMSPWVDGAEAQ